MKRLIAFLVMITVVIAESLLIRHLEYTTSWVETLSTGEYTLYILAVIGVMIVNWLLATVIYATIVGKSDSR